MGIFNFLKKNNPTSEKSNTTLSDTPLHSISLMSYNTQHCLNYITREIDYDMVADTIRKCGADIIGLQEMRDESDSKDYEAQTKIVAEKLGFHHYYFAEAIRFGGKHPYGNALISRYPIISAETIKIPDPIFKRYKGYYETRCILKAKIDFAGGLDVIVSHFGLNPDEHKKAVKTITKNISKERCIVMGDFNMEPENRILRPLQKKLFDTAEKFSSPKLSCPSDKPKMKIDYIFTSKDIKTISADIPEIVSSDHRPHIAKVEIY